MTSTSSNRKPVSSCLRAAVLFAFSSNVVVTILAAYYFGMDDIDASSSLNWLTSVGPRDNSVGASTVSNYVVLMAALDGIAVYP